MDPKMPETSPWPEYDFGALLLLPASVVVFMLRLVFQTRCSMPVLALSVLVFLVVIIAAASFLSHGSILHRLWLRLFTQTAC